MVACSVCGRPVSFVGDPPGIRAEGRSCHLACAPSELVEQVSEEYRAILRKGVRYFVEKYSDLDASIADPGSRFLALGRAVEGERARRQER